MIQRSTRSFQRNAKPAPRPPRSFSPVVALNEPTTLQARAAEAASATALNAKAYEPPTLATSTPPATGPSMKPRLLARERTALAHTSSSGGTRFGIAACDDERYGDCAIAPSAASPISTVGACANTSARLTTAPAASEQIITMRRSKRSPSMPANGAARP